MGSGSSAQYRVTAEEAERKTPRIARQLLEAEVQTSHNELEKQKIPRQLLEEQLKTLECQLLDSTAEKEEIQSLLKDLAARTSACAKAQEQVQQALKDMEELAAAHGAAKVDESMKSSKQVQDIPDLVKLQQSNDAVKAWLKIFCDRLHGQRVERELLEAKLRSGECQLSDPTKQDELQTLRRHFALCSAANLKAEAAIQAVLTDLEALEASKDEVAVASFMGDGKAAAAAEEAPKDAANCGLVPNALGDSEAAAATVDVVDGPRHVAAAHRYDLKDPHALAQFLQDADIRLIRAKYLQDLARSKRPLPRRQEVESEGFEFDGKAESALVSHAEVQNWAEGTRTATICSVSHAWETKEHPDPCRYQLELIADRAAWYEAAFETEVWIFYDFTSLFQYERLFSEEERSFRAAMANMHIMYAHECTMTFIIEHLTPTDVWESTKENVEELIPVWDTNSKRMESKPLKSLVENRTEYLERGWCIGEISWSSLRTHNSQSQRIDWLGSDQVEPGQGQGLTGKVPLTPDKFKERMESAEFTHRDEDLPIVIALQEKIFDEKVAVCEHLVLKGLPEQEIFALAGALPLYRSLKTLKIDTFKCSKEAAEAFGKALAMSQIVSLELRNPRPGSGTWMGKAVVEALKTNQSLTDIKTEDFDRTTQKALAKALRSRLPFDAPVRFKVVAEALEKNSVVTSVTVDPADDPIDDQKAKAVAQLLKSGSPVKSIDLGDTCISDDGAQALAEALCCNRTLEVLCLHEDQITDVGAKALAGALEVNKTLRILTVAAPWGPWDHILRTVETKKRGQGDDFRYISTADEKEAKQCEGDILLAVEVGNFRAVRHLCTEPGSLRKKDDYLGETALHKAARNGSAKMVELLLAANAPVDVKNKNGWTPLHRAAQEGHTEVVQLLLKAKAPVDVRAIDGWTPLHGAASGGHVAVVKLLVEVASLALTGFDGQTALHHAAARGETAVVELLLAANAPVDVKYYGGTPLDEAKRNGNADVVQLLEAAQAAARRPE